MCHAATLIVALVSTEVLEDRSVGLVSSEGLTADVAAGAKLLPNQLSEALGAMHITYCILHILHFVLYVMDAEWYIVHNMVYYVFHITDYILHIEYYTLFISYDMFDTLYVTYVRSYTVVYIHIYIYMLYFIFHLMCHISYNMYCKLCDISAISYLVSYILNIIHHINNT